MSSRKVMLDKMESNLNVKKKKLEYTLQRLLTSIPRDPHSDEILMFIMEGCVFFF